MCCFLSARRITIKRLQRRPRELYAKISWAPREREREKWRAVQCVRESERLRIDKKPNTNRSSTERQREREREQQRESAGEETRQRVQRCENQFGQQPYANLTAETWIDLTWLRTHAGEIRAVICGHTRRMIDISASHEDLKINRANFACLLYGDFNCGLWIYALVVCVRKWISTGLKTHLACKQRHRHV